MEILKNIQIIQKVGRRNRKKKKERGARQKTNNQMSD